MASILHRSSGCPKNLRSVRTSRPGQDHEPRAARPPPLGGGAHPRRVQPLSPLAHPLRAPRRHLRGIHLPRRLPHHPAPDQTVLLGALNPSCAKLLEDVLDSGHPFQSRFGGNLRQTDEAAGDAYLSIPSRLPRCIPLGRASHGFEILQAISDVLEIWRAGTIWVLWQSLRYKASSPVALGISLSSPLNARSTVRPATKRLRMPHTARFGPPSSTSRWPLSSPSSVRLNHGT